MKRLSLLFTVFFYVLSAAFPVKAAETEVVSNSRTSSVDVSMDVPSTFSVLIPKKIVLDGATGSATYQIGIKGDIAGNKKVTIVPDVSITLKQEGKADVTAAITQEKTEWAYNEINADTYTNTIGSLAAASASAGLYTGSLTFTVSLIDRWSPGLYDENGVMICSWEESGIDLSIDYTSSNYETETTSGYYVLTNDSRFAAVKKVVIPGSVTKIGNYAFRHCTNLLSVVIQSGVETIGQCVFDGCTNLTSITIPDSVITIGNSAFWGCTSLASVSIPDSVMTIGEQVFSVCTNLANIIIGNSVTTIGYCAFNRCTSLNSVTIPDSVTKIEGRVFNECNNLSSVTIGNSIATIGEYAFSNCSKLVSVSYGGKAYTSKSALTSAMTTGGVTVESYVFIGTALAD